MTYALKAYNSVLTGQGYIDNITHQAIDWKRTTSFAGGPWQGTFVMYGDPKVLRDWFYLGLFRHIEETVGGITTWDGFVWEMDLIERDILPWKRVATRGRRMRRSLATMFNRIKVAYTDPVTNVQGETSWYEDAISSSLYGQKEEILFEEVQAANAGNLAQQILSEVSGAEAEFVGIESDVQEAKLEVTVVGYAATGQYKFTGTVDDSTSTVSAWVQDVIDTDMPFLTRGPIAPNTTSVKQTLPEPMRAWDLLEDLLLLQGPNDEHYNIRVFPGRTITYELWSPEPVGYFWNGRFVDRAYRDLEVNPRIVQPGIYRDLLRAAGSPDIRYSDSTFLLQPNDFLIEAFEVDQNGLLIPRLRANDGEQEYRTFPVGGEAGGDGGGDPSMPAGNWASLPFNRQAYMAYLQNPYPVKWTEEYGWPGDPDYVPPNQR